MGTLDVGAAKLRLVLHVTSTPSGLTATMDSIDQSANGMKIDTITLTGSAVHFELNLIQGSYDGALKADGSEISGQWKQGGAELPLTMKRIDKAPEAPTKPQDPKKPYPYQEEEVAYENKKAGIKLAGTLTFPRGKGPFPAVLLITGSGPQNRDEALAGHRPFLVLADHLTRHGIAVLRVDDRGVGGSSGDTMKSTSADFADDVLAGIQFLKMRKEVNAAQIGLVGHSEGGMIAPMVATNSPDVAFIVLMAGPGVPSEELLYAQGDAIAKAMGADAETRAKNRELQAQMFAVLRGEGDSAAIEKKMKDMLAKTLPDLTKQQQALVNAQREMALTPWFRYFIRYDPAPVLQKVKCPVLAINGELDLQVLADQNLPAIEAALKAGGNKDYEVRKLAKLNHLLQTAETGSPAEYGKIEETMAPVALDAISDWIVRRTTPH
ncbi:MAG: alpha/beta hydrolase [Candidatus Solibacter usitatus]|nr:alpha/beta hydrolase [Candidatus Solibacter usitatus]